MSRKTRIAVVLSGLWLLGVGALLAAEYLQILPGHCVFDGGKFSHLLRVQGVLLSCDMFSDIPNPWWGVTTIHSGHQFIVLNTFRLVFSSVIPVAAIWLIAVTCPALWRWVTKAG